MLFEKRVGLHLHTMILKALSERSDPNLICRLEEGADSDSALPNLNIINKTRRNYANLTMYAAGLDHTNLFIFLYVPKLILKHTVNKSSNPLPFLFPHSGLIRHLPP